MIILMSSTGTLIVLVVGVFVGNLGEEKESHYIGEIKSLCMIT